LRGIVNDENKHKQYVLGSSMIKSLQDLETVE